MLEDDLAYFNKVLLLKQDQFRTIYVENGFSLCTSYFVTRTSIPQYNVLEQYEAIPLNPVEMPIIAQTLRNFHDEKQGVSRDLEVLRLTSNYIPQVCPRI